MRNVSSKSHRYNPYTKASSKKQSDGLIDLREFYRLCDRLCQDTLKEPIADITKASSEKQRDGFDLRNLYRLCDRLEEPIAEKMNDLVILQKFIDNPDVNDPSEEVLRDLLAFVINFNLT